MGGSHWRNQAILWHFPTDICWCLKLARLEVCTVGLRHDEGEVPQSFHTWNNPWKVEDPNGSAANFNNFFLIAKRIVLNFPRIVFRVPHDFWSKFRCSGIWRTRWSLHWRSRSWWGGRSWQGGWQGPGRCKGGEDRSNLMIFFTDSWVFSEIRLRQLPWSTYPGIKMY